MGAISMAGELEWNFRGGLQGWQCLGFLESAVSERGLVGRTDAGSALDSPALDLDAAEYDTLEIQFSSSRNDAFGICIGTEQEPLTDNYKMMKCLPEAGRLCLFRLRLTPAMNWQGKVRTIRITPSAKDSEVRFVSIRLLKSGENALINGDLRTVLDDRPALWSFAGGARFVPGEPPQVEFEGPDARADVPFAPVDTIGVFRFSFESRAAVKAIVTFFDAEGSPFAGQTIDAGPGDDWRTSETEVTVPEYAYRANVEFRGEDGAALRNVQAVRISTDRKSVV